MQNVFDNQSDGVIILSKPIPKPTTKKKEPEKNEENKNMPEDAKDKDYEDESDLFEQNETMNNADGSFASFVNPTETQGDEGSLEVVFHNQQLFKMLGEKRSADLDEFARKAVFSHNDLNHRMSLLAAALNRYSDAVL